MSKGSSSRPLDAVRDRVGLLHADAQELNVALTQRALDRNRIGRMGFLRRHRPVCPIPGGAVLLTRRADVLEVLRDETTFVPTYADKLPGPFVLGVEGAVHDAQRRVLETALGIDGLRDGIDGDVGRAATRIVAEGQVAGHLDVGADLVHPVLTQVLENVLGLPSPPEGLWFWARDIFEDVFLNVTDLPVIHQRGVAASAQLSAHVRAVVDGPVAPDTVLAQLLAMRGAEDNGWLEEQDAIVFTLIGLAIGWLWHGARAALIVVDELLDRADAMALAQQAARSGDHRALARVLWEVLRFRPVQAFLVRRATTTAVIARGSERETVVAAGTLVLAGTHSAMWDESDVPCPARFDATRADDQYVIFGRGVHRCQGEEINRIMLPALLAPLLAAGNLGRGGRLTWDGPRPDDLRVVLRP